MFSSEGLRSWAEHYLFEKDHHQEVEVKKSSGKFHLVTLKDKTITETFLSKVWRLSYYISPLPLIARFILWILPKTGAIAFYENPEKTTSVFLELMEAGKTEEAKGLCALKKESLNDKSTEGKDAFTLMCEKPTQEEQIKGIEQLNEMTEGKFLTCKNAEGNTPFIIACAKGKTELVKVLYSLYKDKKLHQRLLESKDAQGRTPFLAACERKDVKMIQVLYDIGKEQKVSYHSNGSVTTEKWTLSKEIDSKGRTPFLAACEEGRIEVVKCLRYLEFFSYAQRQSSFLGEIDSQGRTAFQAACEAGQQDIIEYLYEWHSKEMVKIPDLLEKVLFPACERGDVDLLQQLNEISKKHIGGSLFNRLVYFHREALFRKACEEGNADIVELLHQATQGKIFDKDIPDMHNPAFVRTKRVGELARQEMALACKYEQIELMKVLYRLSPEAIFVGNFFTVGSINNPPGKYVFNYMCPNDQQLFLNLCKQGKVKAVQCLCELTEGRIAKVLEKQLKQAGMLHKDVKAYLNQNRYFSHVTIPQTTHPFAAFFGTARAAPAEESAGPSWKDDLEIILGEGVEATSKEQVKKAYRKLSLKWHPDRWSNKTEAEKIEADEEFKKISGAFGRMQGPSGEDGYPEWKTLPER
jgi:ankyrin repeat protein